MMKSAGRGAWSKVGVVGAAACLLACTGDPKGQLIVAVQTDMSVPDDINTLRIDVEQYGGLIKRVDREIRPFDSDGIYLPGTLGIVEGSSASEPITIRVSSKYRYDSGETDGVFRTLREVVTRVPAKRVATLPLPVQWLCSEDPATAEDDREFLTENGDEVDNACGDAQTCIAGTCQDNEVDENDLAEFDPADIGGGGGGGGTDGTCFDTLECFGTGVELVMPDYEATGTGKDIEIDGCTLTVDDIQDLNIALYTGMRELVAVDGAAGDAMAPIGMDAGAPPASGAGGAAADNGGGTGTAARGGSTTASFVDAGAPPPAADLAGDPTAPSVQPVFKQATGEDRKPGSVGGVCFDDGVCLVPLDMGEGTGWFPGSGDEIQLPPAVCKRIEQGRLQGVAIANNCETKTQASPTCGAWASGGEGSSRSAPNAIGGTVTLPEAPPGLIDDFSDGDLAIRTQDGRQGDWLGVSGGDSVSPSIETDADATRGQYLEFAGTSSSTPDQLDASTFLGLLLNNTGDGYSNYDASQYTSVRFYAKADSDRFPLLVAAPPIELIPEAQGGQCKDPCPDPIGYQLTIASQWRQYTVSFNDLFAEGEVYSPETIGGFMFVPLQEGDFVISIDDLEFFDDGSGEQPIGAGGAAGAGGSTSVAPMTCDLETVKSDLIDQLDSLRACNVSDETSCQQLISFEDVFVFVGTEDAALEGQTAVDDYLAEVDMCPNQPQFETVDPAEPTSYCIQTADDGSGVCSALDSRYFTDPDGMVMPPAMTCAWGQNLDPRSDYDVANWEGGVTTVDEALGGGPWYNVDSQGTMNPISPVNGLGVGQSWAAQTVPAYDTLGFAFNDTCTFDASNTQGIRFSALYQGQTQQPYLEITIDTADGTPSLLHPAGRCPVGGDCPIYFDSYPVYPGEYATIELYWDDFGLTDVSELIGVRFRASDGGTIAIDDVQLWNTSQFSEVQCTDQGFQDVCPGGNVCAFNTCYQCGSADFDYCCEGNTCGFGMECISYDFDPPQPIYNGDGWSENAYCLTCGGEGQPCCADLVCNGGTICDDLTYTCILAQ